LVYRVRFWKTKLTIQREVELIVGIDSLTP
jgi:hypothetical protein